MFRWKCVSLQLLVRWPHDVDRSRVPNEHHWKALLFKYIPFIYLKLIITQLFPISAESPKYIESSGIHLSGERVFIEHLSQIAENNVKMINSWFCCRSQTSGSLSSGSCPPITIAHEDAIVERNYKKVRNPSFFQVWRINLTEWNQCVNSVHNLLKY